MDGDVEDGTSKQVTVTLVPEAGGTRITQVMVFSDAADFAMARQIGAEALGQTTLAKLEALAVKLP